MQDFGVFLLLFAQIRCLLNSGVVGDLRCFGAYVSDVTVMIISCILGLYYT